MFGPKLKTHSKIDWVKTILDNICILSRFQKRICDRDLGHNMKFFLTVCEPNWDRITNLNQMTRSIHCGWDFVLCGSWGAGVPGEMGKVNMWDRRFLSGFSTWQIGGNGDCTEKASISIGRRMSLRLRMRRGIVKFVNSFDHVYPLLLSSLIGTNVILYCAWIYMMIYAHTHMCDSSSPPLTRS